MAGTPASSEIDCSVFVVCFNRMQPNNCTFLASQKRPEKNYTNTISLHFSHCTQPKHTSSNKILT